ncbi:MAG: hypothetical protein P8P29_08130 [Flavobacteriaceae bacterium]|nr:hypothetical protein [Flavobacteriaceae bacterium]
MAILNNGSGFIYVDDDPNVDITPNVGEDSEIAWEPSTKTMWYWDRTGSDWNNILSNHILKVTDGVTELSFSDGDTFTFSDGNDINFVTSGTDTITANVVLDVSAANVMTSSSSGLLVDLSTGDGLSGDGTAASPLEINIDTNTSSNILVETVTHGLYVPNEVVVSAGALGGAAPLNAEVGVDNANGSIYYVNSSGNWTEFPTSYSFDISDGTTTTTVINLDSVGFLDSDDINMTVVGSDVKADIILDSSSLTILSSSSSGLLSTIQSGDGLTGAGTSGSNLNINLDTVTAGNSAVITAGQGLYVPNEVVSGTTALSGTAPLGAEFGMNTTTGIVYYVNSSGNWTPVPAVYSFSITDGDTTETVVTTDTITYSDSPTIDFTIAATDNVSAGVKLSTTSGNDITSNSTGLFLDVSALETDTTLTHNSGADPTLTYTAEDGAGDTVQFVGGAGIDVTGASNPNGTITVALKTFTAYANDAAANTGGVSVGELYKLSNVNTYGLPEGLIKERIN